MSILCILISTVLPLFVFHCFMMEIAFVHEMGHAKMAKKLGYNTFVILKTFKHSHVRDGISGIDVYYINILKFISKWPLWVGGICCWDDNCNVDIEKRTKIAEAGYKADFPEYQHFFIPFSGITAMAEMLAIKIDPNPVNNIAYSCIFIIFIGGYIYQSFINQKNEKRVLNRAFKKVLAAKDGDKIKSIIIPDGTRVHNPERYQELLRLVDEKHLDTGDDFTTRLKWVESLVHTS